MHEVVSRFPAGERNASGGLSVLPATRWAWLFCFLLCSVAIAASSFRIIVAPGFEMYLGPLFYLFAYRIGGLRVALPMVLVTMGASWFWWGHVFTIVLALGHVLFVDRVRLPSRSLAISTFVYYLTIGALASFLFLHFHYGASDTIIALGIIRKLLNDTLLAALVDLLGSLLALNIRSGRLTIRRTVSLTELLSASITLIVVISSLVLFVGNVQRFPRDFEASKNETSLRVELHIRRSVAGEEFLGIGQIATAGMIGHDLLIARARSLLEASEPLQTLGCERIDDGSQVDGPNDRNTFAYWVSACHLGTLEVAGRRYYYLYSTRPLAESAYRSVLVQLIGLVLILGLAVLLELFIARALARSLRAWHDVTEGFGRPGLSASTNLIFNEFERPIADIIKANNAFADMVEERNRIVQAVVELKHEMDLSLAADINFDESTGTLSFWEVSIDRVAQHRSELIHSNDCLAFVDVRNAPEAFIEFRLAKADSNDWYLLVARDLLAPGSWRSGWMVRLRQSKLAQNRMLQQARLVELGGMASALSHELKQPLFTMSLCAENGRLLIDQGTADGITRAHGKFDRISEQVNRARDIIGRISRYARIETNDPEPVDIAEIISTTLRFMRPLLVQQNVGAQVSLAPVNPVRLLAPRVGLEQILVNAIQNSVDAIASRREAGESDLVGAIELKVERIDGGMRIAITDNGTGLCLSHPDAAFDAFMTTKEADRGTGLGLYISRQIVMEMSGKITIASREPPIRGAVVTIEFPPFVVLDQEEVPATPHQEALHA